eukprot:COSAG02_NODE_4486_length_5301_cov_3.420223_7_plen_35_part_00
MASPAPVGRREDLEAYLEKHGKRKGRHATSVMVI